MFFLNFQISYYLCIFKNDKEMKVLKFGGTSVGTAESIRNVRSIIQSIPGPKMVVLSAMSGVTNYLVNISEELSNGNHAELEILKTSLKNKHLELLNSLIDDPEYKLSIESGINKLFQEFEELVSGEPSENKTNQILTFGESVLTYIFSGYLTSCQVGNSLLDAKRFM